MNKEGEKGYFECGVFEVDVKSVVVVVLVVEKVEIIAWKYHVIISPGFEGISSFHEIPLFLWEFYKDFFVEL